MVLISLVLRHMQHFSYDLDGLGKGRRPSAGAGLAGVENAEHKTVRLLEGRMQKVEGRAESGAEAESEVGCQSRAAN